LRNPRSPRGPLLEYVRFSAISLQCPASRVSGVASVSIPLSNNEKIGIIKDNAAAAAGIVIRLAVLDVELVEIWMRVTEH